MKPHRILIVIPGVGIGGITTGLLGIIRYLNLSQYQIMIAARQDGVAVRLIRKKKIRCVVMPAKNRVPFLRNIMIHEKIHLVQSCDAVAEGALAAKQLDLPHVWHVGGKIDSVFKGPSQKSLSWFRSIMISLSDQIVVPSRSLARDVFADVPKRKLHVIPWGIDRQRAAGHLNFAGWLKRKLGFNKDNLLVGLVANFYPQKRHLDFLKIASMVHKRIPRARFVIAGQTLDHPVSIKYRRQVIKVIRQLKLANIVKITQFSEEDGSKFFPDLDLILIPSYEGMSQAMLEAGINGIPIVAVNIGAVAEVIQNHRIGFLTPFGNHKKMARAAVEILNHKNLSIRLGKNFHREILTEFAAAEQAKKFSRFYRHLLEPQ